MNLRIGGTVDYATLANLNRPTDPETQRAAIAELRARGYGALSIAEMLKMSPALVEQLLGERRP